MSARPPSRRDDPVSAEPAAEASARAVGFLLSRIDYERTPPDGDAAGKFKLARMADLTRT
jgi:hypothetical protein